MNLLKIGQRYLNMDLLVDAELVDIEKGVTLAILRFAAPWEQAVYRDDEPGGPSAVVPYEVNLRGEPAEAARDWLEARWRGDQSPELADLDRPRPPEGY